MNARPMRRFLVKCTYYVVVDVLDEDEHGLGGPDFTICENSCPNTGAVGAAWRRAMEHHGTKSHCWGCALMAKNEILGEVEDLQTQWDFNIPGQSAMRGEIQGILADEEERPGGLRCSRCGITGPHGCLGLRKGSRDWCDRTEAENEALRARADNVTAERDQWKARAERAEADFANACDVGRRQEARAEQAERERDDYRERWNELLGVRGTLGAAEDECAALRACLAKVEAQLPEGMKHCTIVFKECTKGHGWLTATNWVQHGCPTCSREEVEAACEVLRGALGKYSEGPHICKTPNVARCYACENERALASGAGRALLAQLEGMRGERDSERAIAQEHEAKRDEAEAQAAAMRDDLGRILAHCFDDKTPETKPLANRLQAVAGRATLALAPDAGRALLQRIKLLEGVARDVVEDRYIEEIEEDFFEGDRVRSRKTGQWVCHGCGQYGDAESTVPHEKTCIRIKALDALKVVHV